MKALLRRLLIVAPLLSCACSPSNSESGPSCRQTGGVELATDVLPVRPALSSGQIFAVTRGATAQLQGFDPLPKARPAQAWSLPAESVPVSLATSERTLGFLDVERAGLYAVDPSEPETEPEALATDLALVADSKLASSGDSWFWSEHTEQGGRISRLRGGEVEVVFESPSFSVLELVADPEHVVALVDGEESRSVVVLDASTAEVTGVTMLGCDNISLSEGDVFCPVGDELFALHGASGPPTRVADAAHVLDSTVAGGSWWLVLASPNSETRGTVVRRDLDGSSLDLLSCGESEPTRLAADGEVVAWLSRPEEGLSLSLKVAAR